MAASIVVLNYAGSHMLDWSKIADKLFELVRAIVGHVKRYSHQEAPFALAAILVIIGMSLSGWFPEQLKDWLKERHGLLIAQIVCYVAAGALVLHGSYRLYLIVTVAEAPAVQNVPTPIKGPLPFTPADGKLFRRLGREQELKELLGWCKDDQVALVVVMGPAGAGKTSLLRAGLADILEANGIGHHYWEATPTNAGDRLLRAVQQSWGSEPKPETLGQLTNPPDSICTRRHVIVVDQLEQLGGRDPADCPVLRALRSVIVARPSHRLSWIVAFRREFRPDWADLTLDLQNKGLSPRELSLRLFSPAQATSASEVLISEANLSIEQAVIRDLVESVTQQAEVSPVDIGIGLLILAELHAQYGGRTLTTGDYRFAGGAEGLMTEYIRRQLGFMFEDERERLIKALLKLRDPATGRRIAEGRTANDLAAEAGIPRDRLQSLLDRLSRRDARLLEIAETEGGTDEPGNGAPRYRLAHELLVPALHRLTGQMLAEVDQVRLLFETAYAAWLNGRRPGQYLLRGKELRLVDRHEMQIPMGPAAQDKQHFLAESRRRRARFRLGAVALCGLVVASLWGGMHQVNRHQARTYLSEAGYPPELYDWQHQLRALHLDGAFNLQHFRWLRSDTVEELSLGATAQTVSVAGLESLAACPNLRRLALGLGGTEVQDLRPLGKLTRLTELTLYLQDNRVFKLRGLESLTRLTHLTLLMDNGRLTDLTPLASLANLTHLRLDLRGTTVEELSPLSRLSNLSHLTLDLRGSQVKDLKPLTAIKGLTSLTVRVGTISKELLDKQLLIRDIAPVRDIFTRLEDLTALTDMVRLIQFTVDHNEHSEQNLGLLERLKGVTDLNLQVGNNPANGLRPLSGLTGLKQLTLNLDGSQVKGLEPLEALTGLEQLSIRVGDSPLTDYKPVARLPRLTCLRLRLGQVTDPANDLRPLDAMGGLSDLFLDVAFSKVQDLNLLNGLTKLKRLALDFRGTTVQDLKPLEKQPGLTHLSLKFGYGKSACQVSDLRPIGELTRLASLDIQAGPKVGDLVALEKLTSLTDLTLDVNDTLVTDLKPLGKLTSLTRLDVKLGGVGLFMGGRVQDLRGVESLIGLKELTLNLGNSRVKDLAQLAKLTGLSKLWLDIEASEVNDLKALSELTGLAELRLCVGNSAVSEFEPLNALGGLRKLRIEGKYFHRNRLRSISPKLTELQF